MNPTDKKSPGARAVPLQTAPVVVRLTNGVPAQRPVQPAAPPAYRLRQNTAQTKTAAGHTAAPARGVRTPAAPPVFRPQAKPLSVQPKANVVGLPAARTPQTAPRVASPFSVRPTIQCMHGKQGIDYTSARDHYTNEEIQQVLTQKKLKGVKGHKSRNKHAKQSGQTIHENKIVAKGLRDNRQVAETKRKGCRQFHNKRNSGKRCKFCNEIVD